MIQCVIFDLDDTLYNFAEGNTLAWEAVADYMERVFHLDPAVTNAGVREVMRRTSQEMGSVAVIHNRLIRYQLFLKDQGLPVMPHALRLTELYWNTILDAAVTEPGAEAFLGYLKTRGITVCIGTNQTSYIQFKKLEKLGLQRYVDYVITSEEAGIEKPEPAFFRYCLQRAEEVGKRHLESSDVLFVGDSPKFDMPAAEVGMRAVLYDPHGRNADYLGERVSSYQELLRAFQRAERRI